MEAIIAALIILFWLAGLFGKTQQTRRRTRPPYRMPGMPTFGGGTEYGLPSFGRPEKAGLEAALPDEADAGSYGELFPSSSERPQTSAGRMSGPSAAEYGGMTKRPTWEPMAASDSRALSGLSRFGEDTVRDYPPFDYRTNWEDDRERRAPGSSKGEQVTKMSSGMEPVKRNVHPLFDQQHIVNGIIWSEILGKPKALRRTKR
jgi:hypothetical protein